MFIELFIIGKHENNSIAYQEEKSYQYYWARKKKHEPSLRSKIG
jgi:hypothetical protein